jgi:hypothetical protein
MIHPFNSNIFNSDPFVKNYLRIKLFKYFNMLCTIYKNLLISDRISYTEHPSIMSYKGASSFHLGPTRAVIGERFTARESWLRDAGRSITAKKYH